MFKRAPQLAQYSLPCSENAPHVSQNIIPSNTNQHDSIDFHGKDAQNGQKEGHPPTVAKLKQETKYASSRIDTLLLAYSVAPLEFYFSLAPYSLSDSPSLTAASCASHVPWGRIFLRVLSDTNVITALWFLCGWYGRTRVL
jgi:hypothetical protein